MKTTKTLIFALMVMIGCLIAQAGECQLKFLCGVVKADSWTTTGNNMEGIYEFTSLMPLSLSSPRGATCIRLSLVGPCMRTA